MIARKECRLVLVFTFCLLPCFVSVAFAQTQTTGRISGTVKDQNGAVVVGAEVTVINKATGDERKVNTDKEGNYTVPLLPPGTYRVRVAASGFDTKLFDAVQVVITESTQVDAVLTVA